jgi:hypothetical protein
MRWLAAGLTLVNFATVWALVFGMIGAGLNKPLSLLAAIAGVIAAIFAFLGTSDRSPRIAPVQEASAAPPAKPTRGSRRRAAVQPRENPWRRYRRFWLWFVVACFAVFALRSFCWLLYIDSNELKVQSPNNLGDLGLHLTYINYFANGIPLWPDNPIYVFSRLRYPAGTDLFNALLVCLKIDLIRGLVWAGLLGCLATCYAFYRWAGTFGIAGFLFNGGVAGFRVLETFNFHDYQGEKTIAWKSLALSMLVTQRGMLYAVPAGLLLLCHWRSKFFPAPVAAVANSGPGNDPLQQSNLEANRPTLLPFWVELSLYATMPLFHVHTFICLSLLLAFFFLFGARSTQRHTAILVALAVVPATSLVWVVSDNFHAGSMLQLKPGWVNQPGSDFAMPFPLFWLVNFGAWVPAVLALLAVLAYRLWKAIPDDEQTAGDERSTLSATLRESLAVGVSIVRGSPKAAFLSAAMAMFLLTYFVKTAPWEWDNMKILVWAYFIVLPFLWTELIRPWPLPIRGLACVALFASGFVTLIGGLGAGETGFGIAQRNELDAVGVALQKLPLAERFAVFPTYNHPVLLQGHKAVLGYPGHLWTQGFQYSDVENKLNTLMLGQDGWREAAQSLQTRYLFWGVQEKANYGQSTRPWEKELTPIASGPWGAIYDLQAAGAGKAGRR